MNKTELLTYTRDLINEDSNDSGALLDDTGNLLRFLEDAVEEVVLDLVPSIPGQLLKTKTISLVADQASYSLAATITGTGIAFVDSSPDTITDTGTAFVTSDFEEGMTITVSGTTNNDGDYTIESVVAGTITLDSADALTAESAGSSFTITQKDPFHVIYKIERNVTDKSPREIEIIDPLQKQFHTNVGETEESPGACMPIGDNIEFIKTPSTNKTDYAKVYLVRPETIALPTNGPKYLPRPAHRLICYYACSLIAAMIGSDAAKWMALYENKKRKFLRVWDGRFQQSPRFVREGYLERVYISDLERAFFDIDWP